ncbi:MAG: tetratricopeptide repeat protein [Acidimicrobiales bacterium]
MGEETIPRPGTRRRFPRAVLGFLAAVSVAAALLFARGPETDLGRLRESADDALRRDDCRSAVAHLSRILERDSGDVVVRSRLAGCYQRIGRYGDAERELIRAVREDPSASNYFELADVRITLGRRVAAWEAIETGAKVARTLGETVHASFMARRAGDPRLAKKILDEVPEPNRDDRWLAEHAAAAHQAGDPSYEERYAAAIDAAPDARRPRLLVELGDARRDRGRMQEALEAYAAVSTGHPGIDYQYVNTQIGDIHLLLDRPLAAADAYQAAIETAAPTSSTAGTQLSLARALAKGGPTDRARSVLRSLLASRTLDPGIRAEADALLRAIG